MNICSTTPGFLSFRVGDADRFGILRDDQAVVDLTTCLPHITTLQDAIAAAALAELAAQSITQRAEYRLDEIEFLPIISQPEKIICVGANFPMSNRPGAEKPEYPVLFARFRNTLVAHNGKLITPSDSSTLDFEGELAVVIGREASRIDRSEALQYVSGFTCFNDATIRGWQSHSHQFTPAKNFPGTAAIGPVMTPASSIRDYRDLRIVTRLNGEVMQDAVAGEMIFSLEEVVAYCSSFTRLYPGDIIALGSPDGFGAARRPALYLKPGDHVEVDIPPLGCLSNFVATE
jgi:2-keto-4-pentenoate hydratase/2-oxohepta-3-ene-1,7-dioic acid hydratase in catechol pathway